MMWFSRKVDVTLIDDRTGSVFERAKVAPKDLPESFLWSTTVSFGGRDYSVVNADPPLREEYAKRKKLVLRVAPVVTMSLGDDQPILFSLPTICDALADEAGSADGSELELYEDDWRQFELVHEQHAEVISAELAAIRDVWENARKGPGFSRVHVRSAIAAPIPPGVVPMSSLPELPSRALRHAGSGARIANGFARRFGYRGALYGLEESGFATVLGIQLDGERPPVAFIDTLRNAAMQHGLVLVDWVGCDAVSPSDTEEFVSLLTPPSSS